MNKKEIAAVAARQRAFAEELAAVRPVTRHLVTSVLLDQWPNHTAVVDFGIDTQQHYESLYYPIRNQELTPRQLDDALGSGSKLTALVRVAASNPHKDIRFETSWDMFFGRENSAASENKQKVDVVAERGKGAAMSQGKDEPAAVAHDALESTFQKLLDEKTPPSTQGKEKHKGIER